MSASVKFWRAAIAPARKASQKIALLTLICKSSQAHTQDNRQLSKKCASTAKRTLELVDLRAQLAEVVRPAGVNGADVACASYTALVKGYASQHLQALQQA